MKPGKRKSYRRSPAKAVVCLLALVQGIMLIWMQCCCGESGFKPCSCDAGTASDPAEARQLYLSGMDDCDCILHVIQTPQQPVPLPQPYGFDRVFAQVLPSSGEALPPVAPGANVLYTGLAASPLKLPIRTPDQPTLCVFRC